MATTDSAGDKIGVYQPDFYGNYRYVNGSRPDELGLTGKFYDDDAGLYYFNARWYDSERGHWISPEPNGLDGPNVYQFVYNQTVNGYDSTGLQFIIPVPVPGGPRRGAPPMRLPDIPWWMNPIKPIVIVVGICVGRIIDDIFGGDTDDSDDEPDDDDNDPCERQYDEDSKVCRGLSHPASRMACW